jgi:hypothetical protein
MVTIDPADVRDFAVDADGKTLKYSVGATRDEVSAAEQHEYDQGIHIDDTIPVAQGQLFRNGNFGGRWATQRLSGQLWMRYSLLDHVPDHWKAVDLATMQARELPASAQPPHVLDAPDISKEIPDVWKVALNAEDGRVALLTRLGSGSELRFKPGVELSIIPDQKSSHAQKCTDELCTGKAISSIQWRPHSDEVVFTVTDPHEGLSQSIFLWNIKTGVVRPVIRARGFVNGGRDQSSECGLSADALVCVTAEADRPPRMEKIDVATGNSHILFDPNKALALDIAATVPAQLLRWTDANGTEFTGQYYRPRKETNATPPPLFVTYYTCTGFVRGNLGDEWPLASLAEDGIAALCINHPPGYILDAPKRYGQGTSGVESAVNLLAAKGEIDRTKVGMGGLSFGTEVTMWTLTHSKLLAAASVTSPSIEHNYYLFNSLLGDKFLSQLKNYWGLESLEKTPERWKQISPEFSLEKITAPLLFQMPEQEYIFALDYAIPLIRSVRGDLYVFPNEPHQKFQPKHKLAAYQRNIDWFRFWLQGYERPVEEGNGQYKYWKHLQDLQKANSRP